MSTSYIHSLCYNVKQCNWLLANIGTMIPSQDEECQEAIDFIYDLKLGLERDIADSAARMARQEAAVC